MKRFALMNLALILALSTPLVRADPVREPDSFHWSAKPNTPSVRSYDFEITHGHWTATMFRGDTMLTSEGHLGEAERSDFYHRLADVGVWKLQSTATASGADLPRYRFLVTHHRDQHEAEFNGTPSPDYAPLLKFVSDSVIGHEEQTLLEKLAPGKP